MPLNPPWFLVETTSHCPNHKVINFQSKISNKFLPLPSHTNFSKNTPYNWPYCCLNIKNKKERNCHARYGCNQRVPKLVQKISIATSLEQLESFTPIWLPSIHWPLSNCVLERIHICFLKIRPDAFKRKVRQGVVVKL